MFCRNCGNEVKEGYRFCAFCGMEREGFVDGQDEYVMHQESIQREVRNKQEGKDTFNQNPETKKMEEEWYFLKDTDRKGPYSLDEMIVQYKEGEVKRNTLVWKTGMKNWGLVEQTDLWQTVNMETPDIPITQLNDKYAWALSIFPILSIFVAIFIMAPMKIIELDNEISTFLLRWFINTPIYIFLIYKDLKELEKVIPFDKKRKWRWMGTAIAFGWGIYLLVRTFKTNKKYGYAVVGCFTRIIWIILLMLSTIVSQGGV